MRSQGGLLAEQGKPIVPQRLVFGALGGSTCPGVGLQDGDFLFCASARVALVVVDVVVGTALVTFESGRRREVGHPDVVDRIAPAAVGEVEAFVVAAKWKIRVSLHFLHFAGIRESQRLGYALVVAGAERIDGKVPVYRFPAKAGIRGSVR